MVLSTEPFSQPPPPQFWGASIEPPPPSARPLKLKAHHPNGTPPTREVVKLATSAHFFKHCGPSGSEVLHLCPHSNHRPMNKLWSSCMPIPRVPKAQKWPDAVQSGRCSVDARSMSTQTILGVVLTWGLFGLTGMGCTTPCLHTPHPFPLPWIFLSKESYPHPISGDPQHPSGSPAGRYHAVPLLWSYKYMICNPRHVVSATVRGAHRALCAAVRKVGYSRPVLPNGPGDCGNYCVPGHRTVHIPTQSNNSDNELKQTIFPTNDRV